MCKFAKIGKEDWRTLGLAFPKELTHDSRGGHGTFFQNCK